MAVITRAEITLYHNVDIVSVTRYYLLQPSTAAAPAKPTANPPGGSWVTAEPAYTTGSTNSLYTCELTVFSDGKYSYSDVSLSSSYEAAKAAYNKAVTAQETADAIPPTVPGVNLSPFFSHDIDDVYNAESNPNGYWVKSGSYGWRKNSKYTFTQLEDGWLHVHIDNSTGTSTIRNDCCCPRFNPAITPGTKYTFLAEFRNNKSTGAGTGADFYLVQQSGYVQFWGQNTTDAPAAKLDGIGSASTLIAAIPADGSYAFSRFTKFSEPEGSSHIEGQSIMATFVFRANAGAVLDYDVRLSLYLGEYWGPYVPYVVSDTSAIRKAAEDAAKTATNYIYDSQALGLIVAREAPASDSDVSTIGWHTRQTADGFDVYYNSTRVAHYGDEVWIGAGGRKIKISDNGYRIDRGNTNLMYAGLSEANVLITKSEKWWTDRNDSIYSSIYDSGETITMGSTIASWAVQAIKNVYLSGKPDTPPICLVRGENYTVGSDKSITLKAADTEDADDPMMLYLQDVPDRFGDTDEYHFTASFVVEYTTAAQADYFQFGENSENNGLDALAQGIGCEAGGSYSAAQGDHVKASNVGETAVGRYNESGPDVMFNVGCGTDDNNRKSALMVYGDGKTKMRQILAEDIVAETGAIDALQASSIYGTGGTLTVPTKLEVLKSDTGVVTKAGSVTIQDINSVVRKSGWARLQYSFKANAAIAGWTTVGTTDMFSRPAAAVRCYSNGRFWQITTAGNIQPTSALTNGEVYIIEAVYPTRDFTA